MPYGSGAFLYPAVPAVNRFSCNFRYMRSRCSILFVFTIVLLGSFCPPRDKSITLVLGSKFRLQPRDSIFIPSRGIGNRHINDSLRKYLGPDSLLVKSLLIAQPSGIIDSIDFNMFPHLEQLTLSGNDDDILQNRKYSFMDVKSLKRINSDVVYTHYPDVDTDDYTHKARKRFRKFIHVYRPDIKVRWFVKLDYQILWGH